MHCNQARVVVDAAVQSLDYLAANIEYSKDQLDCMISAAARAKANEEYETASNLQELEEATADQTVPRKTSQFYDVKNSLAVWQAVEAAPTCSFVILK